MPDANLSRSIPERKHTPSPWKFDNHLGCRPIKGGKSGTYKQAQYTEIACTSGLYDDEEDEANARLMSAAPDLLDACRVVVKDHDDDRADLSRDAGMTPPYGPCDCDVCAPARSAIAKALGEERAP